MSFCWDDHCFSGYRTSVAEPDLNFRCTYRSPSVCSSVTRCESVCVPTTRTVCYPQTVVVPKCEPIKCSNSCVSVVKSEEIKPPRMANCFSFIERPNIHVIIIFKRKIKSILYNNILF